MDKSKKQDNHQAPRKEPHICNIDGEPFRLEFPSVDIWRALHQHKHMFKVLDILKQKCGIWADSRASNMEIAGQAIMWSGAPAAQKEGAGQAMMDFIWWREEHAETNILLPWTCCAVEKVNFVPMLVPLDRFGLDQTEEFLKENPNGCLVYGGSFLSSVPATDGLLPLVDPHTVWTIGDTEDKPLQWMAWNGRLIGTAPICQMESTDMIRIFSELD